MLGELLQRAKGELETQRDAAAAAQRAADGALAAAAAVRTHPREPPGVVINLLGYRSGIGVP